MKKLGILLLIFVITFSACACENDRHDNVKSYPVKELSKINKNLSDGKIYIASLIIDNEAAIKGKPYIYLFQSDVDKQTYKLMLPTVDGIENSIFKIQTFSNANLQESQNYSNLLFQKLLSIEPKTTPENPFYIVYKEGGIFAVYDNAAYPIDDKAKELNIETLNVYIDSNLETNPIVVSRGIFDWADRENEAYNSDGSFRGIRMFLNTIDDISILFDENKKIVFARESIDSNGGLDFLNFINWEICKNEEINNINHNPSDDIAILDDQNGSKLTFFYETNYALLDLNGQEYLLHCTEYDKYSDLYVYNSLIDLISKIDTSEANNKGLYPTIIPNRGQSYNEVCDEFIIALNRYYSSLLPINKAYKYELTGKSEMMQEMDVKCGYSSNEHAFSLNVSFKAGKYYMNGANTQPSIDNIDYLEEFYACKMSLEGDGWHVVILGTWW